MPVVVVRLPLNVTKPALTIKVAPLAAISSITSPGPLPSAVVLLSVTVLVDAAEVFVTACRPGIAAPPIADGTQFEPFHSRTSPVASEATPPDKSTSAKLSVVACKVAVIVISPKFVNVPDAVIAPVICNVGSGILTLLAPVMCPFESTTNVASSVADP